MSLLDVFDPSRAKILFGLTESDVDMRRIPYAQESATEEAAEEGVAQGKGRLHVHAHWPEQLRPKVVRFRRASDPVTPDTIEFREPDEPLPQADYVVITWTVAELEALADVLTPGVRRNNWARYARRFEEHYEPQIRQGAPALGVRRLGSYHLTQIGSARVLLFKSELHLNQDGIIRDGQTYATLPVLDLFEQIIAETQAKLVITVGTAGATHPEHHLGEVYISRAVRFRCQQEFRTAPFNNTTYTSDFPIPLGAMGVAQRLLRLQDPNLVEPDFAPPTAHYPWDGAPLPGMRNEPKIRIDGGAFEHDFEEFHPILSTDFFEFGTTTNGLWDHGCALEMGDAVLGLAAERLGDAAPRWLAIRNASDPAINGHLPTGPRATNMQAHWAVWYYEAFGYWTSVNSAIAVWAMIVGDSGQEP